MQIMACIRYRLRNAYINQAVFPKHAGNSTQTIIGTMKNLCPINPSLAIIIQMPMESQSSTCFDPDLKKLSRRSLIRKLSVVLLLPVTIVYGLRRVEHAVTFHPERYSASQSWDIPHGGEDVYFNSDVRLNGWFINSRIQPALATVIYFHGNGGNLSRVGWLGDSLARRGFDVLLFDYRGYGRSSGEISSEKDIYADADAAYDYIVNERGVPPSQVVLYGQSLGTTAVADLASRKQCAAILLESGLGSASTLADTMLPWIPRWLHYFGRNRFDSVTKLARVSAPALVTHGDPDRTIPTEHARALFAALSGPKKLLLFPGADHNVFGFGGDNYLDTVSAFIREVIANKADS